MLIVTGMTGIDTCMMARIAVFGSSLGGGLFGMHDVTAGAVGIGVIFVLGHGMWVHGSSLAVGEQGEVGGLRCELLVTAMARKACPFVDSGAAQLSRALFGFIGRGVLVGARKTVLVSVAGCAGSTFGGMCRSEACGVVHRGRFFFVALRAGGIIAPGKSDLRRFRAGVFAGTSVVLLRSARGEDTKGYDAACR